MRPDEDEIGPGPTPERLARAGQSVEDVIGQTGRLTARFLDGHVLGMLASRGVISGDQHSAGLQFYEDWFFAGLAASGVIDPAQEIVDGGQHAPVSDRRLDAMTDWKDAVKAIGVIHSLPLTCIVLNEEPLEVYGLRHYRLADRKDARLAARVALINALTALDYHYHGRRNTRARASHAANYRPDIDPIDTSPRIS